MRNQLHQLCIKAMNENKHLKQFVLFPCKSSDATRYFFPYEANHMNGLLSAAQHNEDSTYFNILTDSEIETYQIALTNPEEPGYGRKKTTQTWIFDHYLSPVLSHLETGEMELIDVFGGFHELYLNAAIHGNKAGKPEHYTVKRHQQLPENLEQNKNKLIHLNGLVTPRFFLFNIQDSGSGFSLEEKTQNGEDGNTLALSGRGLKLTRNTHMSDVVTYHKDEGFVVAAVKYFIQRTT